MPSVNPSPFGPKPQFLLSTGLPAVGNQLFFYVAGSVNTKQNTYTDSTGGSANANPIVLNALGEPTTQIWFTAGQSYKVVYAPSTDTDPPVSPIWTIDNLVGINDSAANPASEWVAGATPTYISATSFSLVGDQTATYQPGRRIKTTNTGGTIYSLITASAFGAVTTVTVVNDSGALDSGLSAVSYALISYTSTSEPGFIQSGTGATARTQRNKDRDVISINDFGADPGASAATNTTAIQNTINAATVLGQRITANAGTYLITPATSSTDEGGSVTVAFLMASNMHWDVEPGCTFKISNNVSTDSVPKKLAMFHTNSTLSNVSFRNLTMDMNGANNKISPSRPSSYNRYNMSHISVSGTPAGVAARIDDVFIEHCAFINTPGTNCIVGGQSATASVTLGKRWTVRDCLFNNNGLDTDDHSCLYAWVDDCVTEGNTFTADTMQGTTGSTGMTVAYEVHGSNHRFAKNKIRNAYRGMWISSNLTSDVSNTIVEGNTFSPVKAYGIDFYRESAGATAIYKTLIQGNTFGISDDAGGPAPRAAINIAASYEIRDTLIADNVGESVDTTLGAAFFQITPQTVAAQTHTGIVVDGNYALGFTMGALIATNATNGLGTLELKNNTWRNGVAGGGFATTLGIDGSRINAAGAAEYLSLTDNTAIDTRGGSAAMTYGIYLAGTITTLYLKGNDANAMTTAAYGEAGGIAITNRRGDQSGTWSPVRNAFTEVLGGGTITTSGTYRLRDNLCTVTATITAAGGATIAAVAGTSFLSGLPFSSSVNTPGSWVNNTTVAASGATLTASGNLYTATAWGAATNVWVLTATYPTA